MDSEHVRQEELEKSPELVVKGESAPGSLFQGKYEILSTLGTGGMGIVYKARDLSLNRLVAIKMLPESHTGDDQSLLRFQQEARAVGALNHAGIVSIHEFAVSDNNRPYIVMDYIEGSTLSSLLSTAGHLSIDECLEVVLKVADALTYAHGKGVIHRDLKPANIMLLKEGNQSERIKVVDFGIAKLTTEGGKSLTQTGEIFGSPFYMSPEQCSGAKIDHRSDIYSLGCVLYESLTGRVPHMGETALSTALMHLQQEPLPLSAVQPNLHFPDALQSILDKALAKNAYDRYQSMAEFQDDLEKLKQGKVDQLTHVGAHDKHRRILNSLKQRLTVLFGIVSLVSATFVSNPTISGFLYLLGGLMLIFSIPGLRGDGTVSQAMQRQSRDIIPMTRTEIILWIVLIPLLLGLSYVFAKNIGMH